MNKNQKTLKDKILLYRYAYYVKGLSLIGDQQYDMLEKEYIKLYGDDLSIGSERELDYPQYIIDRFKNREF